MSYCHFIQDLPTHHLHRQYHDHSYGFQLTDDTDLFARQTLELFQAGVSWTIILKKQDNFWAAFNNFDIPTVAAYDEEQFLRLMADAGIIRNRLKIKAAIHNAQVILGLQASHGSFYQWLLDHYQPTLAPWVTLFRKHFKFMGPEIINEFLMSTGFLPGAHQPHCEAYQRSLATKPVWLTHA